uniref:Uncharacterized protein n=1 Tax=Macrostomum lignano TaxID=282301 RepID=A0A1I8FSS2_9PLAT
MRNIPQQPPHQRQRQRTMLAPSADGQQYVIAHVSGYLKQWASLSAASSSAIGRYCRETLPARRRRRSRSHRGDVLRSARHSCSRPPARRICLAGHCPSWPLPGTGPGSGRPLWLLQASRGQALRRRCLPVAHPAAAASSDAAAEYRQVHCSLAAFHNPCSDELEFLLCTLRQCGAQQRPAAAAIIQAARNDGAPRMDQALSYSCWRKLLLPTIIAGSLSSPSLSWPDQLQHPMQPASPASSWAAAAAAAAPHQQLASITGCPGNSTSISKIIHLSPLQHQPELAAGAAGVSPDSDAAAAAAAPLLPLRRSSRWQLLLRHRGSADVNCCSKNIDCWGLQLLRTLLRRALRRWNPMPDCCLKHLLMLMVLRMLLWMRQLLCLHGNAADAVEG